MNDRTAVPLPPAYDACRGGSVASLSRGSPSTPTGSSKATVMLTIRPVPYAPSGPGDVTRTTVGGTPSIAMSLECPSDPGVPGSGRNRMVPAPSPGAARIDAPPSSTRASTPV